MSGTQNAIENLATAAPESDDHDDGHDSSVEAANIANALRKKARDRRIKRRQGIISAHQEQLKNLRGKMLSDLEDLGKQATQRRLDQLHRLQDMMTRKAALENHILEKLWRVQETYKWAQMVFQRVLKERISMLAEEGEAHNEDK